MAILVLLGLITITQFHYDNQLQDEASTSIKAVPKQERFFCYSPPLFLFLLGKNIKGTENGVNQRNGRHYTIFPMTDTLSKALKEWSVIRKK